MDRILRRELDAIARDRTSGAAELADKAVKSVSAWLGRNPKHSKETVLNVARLLCKARWDMAPIFRFANDLALCIDEPDPSNAPGELCRRWKIHIRTANRAIAEYFARAVRNRNLPKRVVTYSYSSTVLHALVQSRKRIRAVRCSEARPGLEGRKTARLLARAGIAVIFHTDAALLDGSILGFENVVLGADEVTADWFVCKMGAGALTRSAVNVKRPVWVLTDSSKFRPRLPTGLLGPAPMRTPSHLEVWRHPPKGVLPWNTPFIRVRLSSGIKFLTEKGWMTPARVRREIAKIKLSPRLKELLD